ncbi:MAG TPA: cation diffusion facilitator family transporter [Clostridium sp.]
MIRDNFKEIKKVLWIIMFANIVVAVAKIIMGIIINSSSMTADGFHSITDGSSNIIGLIGIGVAAKPIDDDHPYGHRKFETLTGLFIVGMLVFLGFKIMTSAVTKLMNPIKPEVTIESLIVMMITLCINIFVTKYEHRKGTELNSTILISDSMHTRSDIYVTIGVIITLVAIKLGAPPIVDGIASLIVAIFIFHAAYEIFGVASSILVDSKAVDIEKIEKIVIVKEGVKGVHKIRSRGTIDDMHIDMHILADSRLNLEEAHRLAHEIQDSLRKELNDNADVIVHLEPYKEDTVNKVVHLNV